MPFRSRVLIADNDAANVQLLTDICQGEDLEVLVAEDGKQTLKCIRRDNPDIVLLDVMMPELDGFEVLQELRRQPLTHDLPVILVTAVTDDDSIRQGYQLGANDYITKPFKVAELVARVNNLIKAAAYQQLARGAPSSWALGDGETLTEALSSGPAAPVSLCLFRLLRMDHHEEAHGRTTVLRAAQQVGIRLRYLIRGDDSAHLLRSDLLALVLVATDQAGAEAVARRLERSLEASVSLNGTELDIGCKWTVVTENGPVDTERLLHLGLDQLEA
jgi:CheY-like chemotaxis protein